MMANLTTSFLGVEVKNPIIVASSPLTESAAAIYECEKYGAGAVIAKSCSSTRLKQNGYRRCVVDEKGWWAASTFNREIQDVEDSFAYLEEAVRNVKIPIFASVSELSLDSTKWLKTCQLVQETGVAGIQLDLFYFDNVLGDAGFRERFIDLLTTLKSNLAIPIFPKLNINLPSLYMADIFKESQINHVSLLDSVSLPSPITIDGAPKMRYASKVKRASLFGPWQLPLTMKYLYDFQVEGFSVCAGGGIHNHSDIIELLLLGAQTIQVATTIILGGYRKLTELIYCIENYMNEHDYESIDDFRGTALSKMVGEPKYQMAKAEYNEALCTGCGRCTTLEFCLAINIINDKISINKAHCDGCSLCVDMCPSKALHLVVATDLT